MRSSNARAAALVLIGAACATAAQAQPAFDAVRAAHRPSDITLVDRHGVPLQTLRVDASARRLAWVPLAEVSPALRDAVVRSEDRRFHEHAGVDWGAAVSGAAGRVADGRGRGASTLTMQLAALLDPEQLARPAGGRSVVAKAGQAWAAMRLERAWTKEQILEAYLNRVPWRGEVVGVGALAQTLFGKHPAGIDTHEAAVAAVLLRAPNAAAEVVARRACALLGAAAAGGGSSAAECTAVEAVAQRALARRGGMPLGEQLAPHHARRVVDPAGPAVQRTTLDAALQRIAVGALRRQLAALAGQAVDDGAVVVLDNTSGEVLAWVGSSGALSAAREVDGVLARRQPGSTLKPFVYASAIERGIVSAATLLDDAPTQIETAHGLYAPRNYDGGHQGLVSVRTALGASLNLPAVRVAALLGPDALYERLNAAGLSIGPSAGHHGIALALGSADVTLLGLADAYRALANGGVYRPAATRLASPARGGSSPPRPAATRVVSPSAAWIVGDILADDAARARTFGLASTLATSGWAAVKTGTSKDLRDNWCVGYTDRHTVAVWVGNASGAPMRVPGGTAGAAPVWAEVVAALNAGRVSRAPAAPAGVVVRRVRFERGVEAERDEAFVAGTESAEVRTADRTRPFGIAWPRDGSVFALDPDIPVAAQRIVFEGEPGRWRLDDRALGRGTRIAWLPRPGRHELTLAGDDGRILGRARFEVR